MLLGSSDTSNVDNAIAIPRHLYTCPILNTNANVLVLRYFITARAGTIVLDCIALSYICVSLDYQVPALGDVTIL